MKTEEIEQHLQRLTLATKPISEATAIKLTALLLAGMAARESSELDPDAFLEFVVAYCLRDDSKAGSRCEGVPEVSRENSDGANEAALVFAWNLWAPWRQRILQRSRKRVLEAIGAGRN